MAGLEGWGVAVAVAVAKIGVVGSIVGVVGVGLGVVDREVVLEALHMVRHGGVVLAGGLGVGSGSAVLHETGAAEAVEEQTHNGGYFDVEVRWRCTGHGEGWVAELAAG